MTSLALFAALGLLLLAVVLLLVLLAKASKADATGLGARLDGFEKAQDRAERSARQDAAQSREEQHKASGEQRKELTGAFKMLGDSVAQRVLEVAGVQKAQLDAFSRQLGSFAQTSVERLDGVRQDSVASGKLLREELATASKNLSETVTTTMAGLAAAQKAQLDVMSAGIGKLSESNEKKLEQVRATVEGKLQSIQTDNAKQLEQMRLTVDEKLQGTLEKRLSESFKQVSERLELVHKGLGEMQTLATGVGDLKKVLTNVKTRGTWGEVQLGTMLAEILNPEQFAANVSTKGGGERVEFAIKLPGQNGDKEDIVWLPIDAKFPIEDYHRLLEAQDKADGDGAEAAGKQLEIRVKGCAKDICDKYLSPPKTTDFGVLFLPIEGLFAEVIRRPGLAESVQRDFRVVIAGPTTLWSILNSLQMGFRTLAIQKRSSEVWNLLAAVKTEWTKYGVVLDSVQKKLQQASETIDKAQTRSRAIGRKLKDVQELPASEAARMLPVGVQDDDDEIGEGDDV